ncbi:hypothetical protein PCANC_15714 [Puccinia coronata f. sp. avenae]|uniref:Uncharacterized protein n=1 Tax=Puccinia coronata f. sp. avenae TaxID=200324 RepID=A0A2N5SND8_9BASI|nr:hypothetical protein PCANC_15714 [Puccinia coronata f. sp. avenae]
MLGIKSALARCSFVSILFYDNIDVIAVATPAVDLCRYPTINNFPTWENEPQLLATEVGISQTTEKSLNLSKQENILGHHVSSVKELGGNLEVGARPTENSAKEFPDEDMKYALINKPAESEDKAMDEDITFEKAADTSRRSKKKKGKKKGMNKEEASPPTVLGCENNTVEMKKRPMAQNNQRVKVNTQEEHCQEELQDVGNSITIKLEGQPEHLQQSSKVDCDVVSSSIMKDYLARELKRQLHRQDLMRTSFQPTEYPKPGEIYPGVFKGLYSDFVHSSEPLLKDLDKTAQAEESSPISTVLILKILKNQLQLLNLDDHLPLPELSNGDYRVLKLLWNSNPEKMLRDIEQESRNTS